LKEALKKPVGTRAGQRPRIWRGRLSKHQTNWGDALRVANPRGTNIRQNSCRSEFAQFPIHKVSRKNHEEKGEKRSSFKSARNETIVTSRGAIGSGVKAQGNGSKRVLQQARFVTSGERKKKNRRHDKGVQKKINGKEARRGKVFSGGSLIDQKG